MKASQRSLANFLWVEIIIMFGLLAIKHLGLHPLRAQLFSYKASLQAPFSVSTTKIFNRNCVRTLLSHLHPIEFGNINMAVGKRFSSRIVTKQFTFSTVNGKDEPSTHTAHYWCNCVNVLSRLTLVEPRRWPQLAH